MNAKEYEIMLCKNGNLYINKAEGSDFRSSDSKAFTEEDYNQVKQWLTRSFWHDVKEKPVFDPANIACNQILVIGKIKSAHGDFTGSVCQIMDDGTIYAPVSGHHYEWGSCPFSQWAYLKDILPSKKN